MLEDPKKAKGRKGSGGKAGGGGVEEDEDVDLGALEEGEAPPGQVWIMCGLCVSMHTCEHNVQNGLALFEQSVD